MIVDATTDRHTIERRNGEVMFEVVKRVERPWTHGAGRVESRP